MYSKMGRSQASGGLIGKDDQERGDQENKRIYSKVAATFLCQKEGCNHSWRTIHGWSGRKESAHCSTCGSEADLTYMVDKKHWFDHFGCCSNMWQKMHIGDPDEDGKKGIQRKIQDQCPSCGGIVTPSGLQNRHARLYFFRCVNDKCSEEKPHTWSDFAFGQAASQRCQKCKVAKGSVVEVVCLSGRKAHERKRKDPKSTFDETGPHLVGCCDMCQKLKKDRIYMTCMRWKQVHCQLERNSDGTVKERVFKGIPIAYGYEFA